MREPDEDMRMLASALDLDVDAIAFHSREPLGGGSVTGAQVDAGEPLLYYVDTSGLPVPAETGLVARADEGEPTVRIWQHPSDPHLPGLAPVAFHHAAQTLLARLGIVTDAVPELVAYRPGRRAVLRIQASAGPVWLKVVRPSRVERIVRAGTAVAAAGLPVPAVHGWSGEGLIVMADAAGVPAQDVEWDPQQLLDEVGVLRSALARADWDHRGAGTAARLEWYESHAGPRASEILTAARRLLDAGPGPASPTVIHGDLHFGQLFLEDRRISGLIDVDTLALGDAAEDSAAFLSHAIASALLTDYSVRARVWALADLAADTWGADDRVRGLTLTHLAGHLIAAEERGDHDHAIGLADASHAIIGGREPSAGAG
ncbi:phosphotransferase family protein [Microbacterium abyssi]|uniref:phosphotransferase family protein n=1 Tax=Microbacterium abyssi TaxID=2782166 RepID=UPI001887AA5E|nr:phosphotransferase [Microbacterium sp. A18JL241]